MKLSMWTSYFFELSPEEAVETLVRHGWRYGELSDEHGWMLLERGDPETVGTQFRRFCAERGFAFSQGHFYLAADLAHPDQRQRKKILEDLKRWCDLFNALDVKAGVLHPENSLPAANWSAARMLECRLEMLEELLNYSRTYSFTICLENLLGLYKTCDDLLQLSQAVKNGEALGICFDTGHLNRFGGNGADFVRQAGPRLQALHITDSIDKYDHLLPGGAGTINWAELVQALKDVQYDGLFNFEIPRENKCPMPIRLAKLDYALKLGDLLTAN